MKIVVIDYIVICEIDHNDQQAVRELVNNSIYYGWKIR